MVQEVVGNRRVKFGPWESCVGGASACRPPLCWRSDDPFL
jgi:hypothetical protein